MLKKILISNQIVNPNDLILKKQQKMLGKVLWMLKSKMKMRQKRVVICKKLNNKN